VEVADRPGPLRLEQPQQVHEVCRRVRGAGGQPPGHLVQFGQYNVAFVAVACADLRGEGEPAQHVGHGGRVEARSSQLQRHRSRGVPCQADRIVEDRRGDRVAEMRVEKRERVVGVCVRRGCRGDDFAAQHAGQPLVRVEHLAGLLAAGTPHEGQPRRQLGDEDVQ
jgi:hypothetical protein